MVVNIHFLTLFVGFEWTEPIIRTEGDGLTQKFYRKETVHLYRFLAMITRQCNTASSIVASLIHLLSIYMYLLWALGT